jgi:hypothetical protein
MSPDEPDPPEQEYVWLPGLILFGVVVTLIVLAVLRFGPPA